MQVTGANGVPAGASGAVVNLIAINSTSSDGNLTPYATGSTKPQNSLHYTPSATTSIQAQVGLSAGGKMTIANASSTINLVIDLQGYFTAAGKTGAVFTPGVGRAYDSRATGNTILAKNETRSIPIAGKAGVPVMGSGITAVVLTLIVAHGGSDGRAAVWADGATKPDTTSINFQTDEIRTNTVTVPLGANGKISLNNVADPTNYVIDVQGWYVNPTAPTITCPQPYYSESVIVAATYNAIQCTISAAPATNTDEQLVYAVDSEDVTRTDLSQTGTTSATVTIAPTRGVHAVTAYRAYASGDSVEETDYSFTLGDWSTSGLQGVPSAGEITDEVPYLGVSLSEQYTFPVDAIFEFTVSSDNAGATVVWDSGEQSDDTVQTAGLPEGDYFWHAVVRGTSAEGTAVALTTPTFSFSTSAHAAGDDVSGTAAADEGTYTAGSPVAADENVTSSSMASMRTVKYTPVPACGATTDENKKVTKESFPRRHWDGVVSGGHADLVCGTPGTRGMRHIWRPCPGHKDDWIRVASKYPTGLKPEELMVGAFTTTYAHPFDVKYRDGNDSYAYYGILEIKDTKGRVARIYTVQTGVGNGNWKVITGFPTNGRKP